MKVVLASTLIAVTSITAWAPAFAQDKWPSKTIELVHPYPPGNDTDALLRLIAQGMSKRLGVPVQVINKPGGGGVVGTNEIAKAKPDGYTLGTFTLGAGIAQVLAGVAPYKQTDFTPISGVFSTDFVLAARADIPANNIKELANWSKSTGKPVVVGTYSPTSVIGLVAARVARQAGFGYKIVSFPNPSAKELTAGDADVVTTSAEMVSPFVKAKQVKVLSSWAPERAKHYPDVQTSEEEGFGEINMWVGLFAPAGVPPEIADKLSEAVRQTLTDKEPKELLARIGSPAYPLTRQEMAQRIQFENKWISELMNELGMSKK
ncbi:tripartite tricarboxylate transporter substrate binding protein [Hydrogenophaga sp. YM1]|uniref:Bug family tripartite tricarboxylate transporter substrate binding protein n=1 Tax=Hydrogenophaga sp. YM1 TaxID=2806262 RepID=UPI00195D2324|nr:tripartite tricarboxylate transporter substrate binding protein [Hydrogenophaga sp. YM1]QRR35617.1 tripartite tricarboxylate transporter substrate binding protein [Hydrogenophaga sp. YM1]